VNPSKQRFIDAHDQMFDTGVGIDFWPALARRSAG
jgi:hypothetical protein